MAGRSKLSQAAREVQAEFARLVGEGVSYDAILAKLRELGADMSRSGVGREAAKLKKAIRRKEEATALAEQFARNIRGSAQSPIVRGAAEALGSLIHLYLDAQDDPAGLDPKEFMALGRAIESLGKAKNLDIAAALKNEEAEARTAAKAEEGGTPGTAAGRLEIVFVESPHAGAGNPLEALAPKAKDEEATESDNDG